MVMNGNLRGLVPGMTATESDNITCDNADSIGITIQQQFNGMHFIDMSINKKDTVKTLSQLSCAGQSVDKRSG